MLTFLCNYLPPSLTDPEPYFVWIIAVVVSACIILIVVTVMVVVVIVTHNMHCIPVSTSTTPEESSSGSDFKPSPPPKTKLVKQGSQIMTKVQVVTPVTVNVVMNWDKSIVV